MEIDQLGTRKHNIAWILGILGGFHGDDEDEDDRSSTATVLPCYRVATPQEDTKDGARDQPLGAVVDET